MSRDRDRSFRELLKNDHPGPNLMLQSMVFDDDALKDRKLGVLVSKPCCRRMTG